MHYIDRLLAQPFSRKRKKKQMKKETGKVPDRDMTTEQGHGASHPTKENSSEKNNTRETEGGKYKGNPEHAGHKEGAYDKQSRKPMQDK